MNKQTAPVTLSAIKNVIKRELTTQEARFESKLKKELSFREAILNLKLEELERKIDDKAQLYRDQVLNSNVKIAAELEQIREDVLFRNKDIEELKVEFKKHIKRTKKLENN